MKIKVEDKVITRTFVKLDDYECELAHLYEIIEELGDCDLLLHDQELRDKLIMVGVAKKSVFRGGGISRGNKFETFQKRIEKLYNRKYPQTEEV